MWLLRRTRKGKKNKYWHKAFEEYHARNNNRKWCSNEIIRMYSPSVLRTHTDGSFPNFIFHFQNMIECILDFVESLLVRTDARTSLLYVQLVLLVSPLTSKQRKSIRTNVWKKGIYWRNWTGNTAGNHTAYVLHARYTILVSWKKNIVTFGAIKTFCFPIGEHTHNDI